MPTRVTGSVRLAYRASSLRCHSGGRRAHSRRPHRHRS